ncbi:hypothetical protein Pcinc_003076 [Petrolisthes cinctipes]|uniref:Polyprotein n=1 Tax=Petrolisthes cinctipes TaxID=88211 RepID=A0AAE1GGZ2_PETCI|nr:hypothetical protein Pcinc_003076 [Petrolisthes cinctipes]
MHSEEWVSDNDDEQPDLPVRLSERVKRPPDIYGEWVSVGHKTSDPTSVSEALLSDDKEHWMDAMKQEMSSIQESDVYELVELPKGNFVGYSDADWAGDIKDRKSTSGYCFHLGGGPVSWSSKKQSCVALSTAEAEYMALASAIQEAVWFRKLAVDIQIDWDRGLVTAPLALGPGPWPD